MVRYPFDVLRAVSPSTLLRTLRFSKGKVKLLTMNGTSDSQSLRSPFALRYRRVNGSSHKSTNLGGLLVKKAFFWRAFSLFAFPFDCANFRSTAVGRGRQIEGQSCSATKTQRHKEETALSCIPLSLCASAPFSLSFFVPLSLCAFASICPYRHSRTKPKSSPKSEDIFPNPRGGQ